VQREVYDGFVEMVEVVVELEHPREGDMKTRRSHFDDRCRDLEQHISRLGGEVVGKAWINSTLLVRVPQDAVSGIADREEVVRVETPHRIERE
jgi:hypothetical protein